MTRFVIENTRIFHDSPIVIVDVGARDGFNAEWKVFEDCLRVYCFEPDEAECARLNANAPQNVYYIPAALGSRSGEAVLYQTKLSYSTGLYKTDMTYFSRLLNRDNGIVVGEQSIRLSTLGDILSSYEVRSVDFIKLDAEGAELDILQGATALLSSPRLAGILSEVRFQREINNAPIFSDLDAFLRPHGFHLYDLQFYHQSRHILPYPSLADYLLATGERFFAYTTHGQIMDGDALYFRDLLTPINAERATKLDAAQILKYAAFFEIYSLNDCAAELLVANQFALNNIVNCSQLLDLLTPQVGEERPGFREYRNRYFGRRDDDVELLISPPREPPIVSVPPRKSVQLSAQLIAILRAFIPGPIRALVPLRIKRGSQEALRRGYSAGGKFIRWWQA